MAPTGLNLYTAPPCVPGLNMLPCVFGLAPGDVLPAGDVGWLCGCPQCHRFDEGGDGDPRPAPAP
jgi:hypothetical protein